MGLGIIGCSDDPAGPGGTAQLVKVIVRFEGDGSGRVHSPNSTVGIDCVSSSAPNSCTNSFAPVGAFELLATPNVGSTLALWACSSTHPSPVGNCEACTGVGTCELSTACCDDVTLTVIARFELEGAGAVVADRRQRR